MYHSYVMGVDDSIRELTVEGFEIKNDGNNYMVAFPKEKSSVWEAFISAHLELGYWNEYLTEYGVVFLFHLEDGIKRYEVYDFNNNEVLSLCEKLCECKFESLKHMLTGNHYYREIIG
ncbi:MAG: hypothetical protein J6A88_07485 [Oscillospiraceae bacterium]|nr:hypothetical protein [Oscillospiraceae bacterium]